MVLEDNIPRLTHHNLKRRVNSKSQAPNNKQLLCDPFEILNIAIWILFVICDLNIVI